MHYTSYTCYSYIFFDQAIHVFRFRFLNSWLRIFIKCNNYTIPCQKFIQEKEVFVPVWYRGIYTYV